MCCAGQALEADFTGVIRQQDVRSHDIDKVCVYWGRWALGMLSGPGFEGAGITTVAGCNDCCWVGAASFGSRTCVHMKWTGCVLGHRGFGG